MKGFDDMDKNWDALQYSRDEAVERVGFYRAWRETVYDTAEEKRHRIRRAIADEIRHFWDGATAEEGYVLGVISGTVYTVIAVALTVWLKGWFRW